MTGGSSFSLSRAGEVEWGESQEARIVSAWAKLSKWADGAASVLKLPQYADYDFALLDSCGLPVCWVEVKSRRSRLDRFGDILFPLRKHEAAVTLRQKHRIPAIGVTQYSCGSLIEVGLWLNPEAVWEDFQRHDRPGKKVPHVLYNKSQGKILRKASS